MPARYAVYYAPRRAEPLHLFARYWLGRDALTGDDHPRLDSAGLDAGAFSLATASPRHYGFHATLKPPFALAKGKHAPALAAAAAAFAQKAAPVKIGPLGLKWINDFLALVPLGEPEGLRELAGECVSQLDGFRAPPAAEETKRRLAAGLNQRQRELLALWGYPYVMDEFRFHLTLTSRLGDPDMRQRIEWEAARRLNGLPDQGLVMDSVCLFKQPELDKPFTLVRRFGLTGA